MHNIYVTIYIHYLDIALIHTITQTALSTRTAESDNRLERARRHWQVLAALSCAHVGVGSADRGHRGVREYRVDARLGVVDVLAQELFGQQVALVGFVAWR